MALDVDVLNSMEPWQWPRSARDTLMTALRDRKRSASDRVTAAKLAGDLVVMNDDMANLLLSVVRDPQEAEALRAKAAISLGPVLEEVEWEGGFEEGFESPYSAPSISEEVYRRIVQQLHENYRDESVPKEVRRRILEASVRSPQEWHQDAVRAAYQSGDQDWKLTAAFCMRWISGFDDQIMELLQSRNPKIQYEAVLAAGAKEVEAAWPHISALIESRDTRKLLRLAAIEAAPGIRPGEAKELLADLLASKDKDIVEAARDAMSMAGPDEDDEDEEDEDWDDQEEDDEEDEEDEK